MAAPETDKAQSEKTRFEQCRSAIAKAVKQHFSKYIGCYILITLVAVLVSVFIRPNWWTQHGNCEWNGSSTRNLIFVIGGLGAMYGLAISARRQATNEAQQATNLEQQATSQKQYELAQKQYELAQKENFSDTFAKAVDAIAADSITIKTSGIRIFESLAKSVATDSDDYRMIVKNIEDFIRETAAPPNDENGEPMDFGNMGEWPAPISGEQRQHIEVALMVLGKLADMMGVTKHQINLSGLDFRGLNLDDVFLGSADLERCNLGHISLRRADLTDAVLTFANLTRANLEEANLTKARAQGANLTNASLRGANFTGADLSIANFTGADLNIANFTDALLIYANLTDAILWGDLWLEKKTEARAYYEETSPEDFDRETALKILSAANFSHAILFGAYFSSAELPFTKAVEGIFTGAQLEQMKHKPEVLTREDVKAWLNHPDGDPL